MLKYYKNCLLLLFVLLFPNLSFADDFYYKGLIYTPFGDDEAETKEGNLDWMNPGSPGNYARGEITIPEYVYDNYGRAKRVTKIAAYSFSQCSSLTKVTLPKSIKQIDRQAFQYSGITEITIPGSVVTFGSNICSDCQSLERVIIEEGVTEIPENAFYDCNSLSEISIPQSVTSIASRALFRTGLKSVALPNSLISIGYESFCLSPSLEGISVPESLESIGKGAFNGCSKLKAVVIPNKITEIDEYVFKGCSSLESLTLSENLVTISVSAFENCSSLTSVVLPSGIKTIGMGAFEGCSLKSIEIPSQIETIVNYAFYGNPITDVTYLSENPKNYPVNEIFSGETYVNATLHYLDGYLDKYKSTWPWSLFRNLATSGVDESAVCDYDEIFDIYSLNGVLIKSQADKEYAKSLSPGIYIFGDKKVVIKR